MLSNPPDNDPLIPVSSRLYDLNSDHDKDVSTVASEFSNSLDCLRFSYALHGIFDTKTGLTAYSRMAERVC